MQEIYNQRLNRKVVILNPGEYFATNSDLVLSTLLGSCVAACLYDPVNNIIGMNHFLLAGEREHQKNIYLSEAGRYGINAMELLITQMMKLGANRKNLKAKAFGGANVTHKEGSKFSFIPKSNVDFVKNFLKSERTELVASDFGGQQGRKILFFNNTFNIYAKKLDSANSRDVAKETAHHWKKQKTKLIEKEKNRIDKSIMFD